MADRPPLRVPEATAQHAVGTRRTTSRSAPSLTDAFCDTCGVIAGPLRADEASAWVWGHLAAGPPSSLPAVLSSVEDVARVCKSAGLAENESSHPGYREWIGGGVRVTCWFADDVPMCTGVSPEPRPLNNARHADLWPGTAVLTIWSAIQAARGGEHCG